jgi:hypothetical protein
MNALVVVEKKANSSMHSESELIAKPLEITPNNNDQRASIKNNIKKCKKRNTTGVVLSAIERFMVPSVIEKQVKRCFSNSLRNMHSQ